MTPSHHLISPPPYLPNHGNFTTMPYSPKRHISHHCTFPTIVSSPPLYLLHHGIFPITASSLLWKSPHHAPPPTRYLPNHDKASSHKSILSTTSLSPLRYFPYHVNFSTMGSSQPRNIPYHSISLPWYLHHYSILPDFTVIKYYIVLS